MDQRRIKMSDIIIGEPLPWDVYDAGNHLLLRKGHIVEREQQVEVLMERGLFVDAKAGQKKENTPAQTPKELPSVLRLVNLAYKRLEKLLLNIATEPDFQGKIFEVVQALSYAMNINSDIALACILLNQASGRYPARHCIDTSIVAALVARALKISPEETKAMSAAALTMNVGMLRHQERLQEVQGPLSDEDAAIIRSHPQQSVAILRQAGVSNEEWLSYVLLHHENEDGSGYPSGKRGSEVPLCAKIISIADRYCARVAARSYRKSLLPNAALRDILVAEKNSIDPALATAFIRELGTFPTGSFVRLENGEVGVVSGKGSTTTAPIVHSLIGPRGVPLSFPIKRDTSKQLSSIREVLSEEQANIRFSMQQIWGDEASL